MVPRDRARVAKCPSPDVWRDLDRVDAVGTRVAPRGVVLDVLFDRGRVHADDGRATRAHGPLSAAAANSTAGAAAVAAGIAASSPSAPGSVARVGAIRAALDRLRVYQDLSKFKLSVFVVSTAATGYALGSGERVDWREMGVVSLGTFLCSASANTFNQVFEKTNDGKMARTMRRPLPAGRCSRAHALAFGVVSGIAGYVLLRTQCNALTANLGVANIAAYALCYTPMKQAHWINTWVGALVGAVPPLMGWAAARDAVEPAGLILAAALYFWQMPHFMALAFMARDDYVRGGYRMMSHPLFDRSGRRVAAVALRNAAAMLPLGLAAVACGLVTPPFAYEAGILAMPMALSSAVFYRRPNVANARRVFYGSLLYLPAFQVLAAAHRVPRTEPRARRRARWSSWRRSACPPNRGRGPRGASGGGRPGRARSGFRNDETDSETETETIWETNAIRLRGVCARSGNPCTRRPRRRSRFSRRPRGRTRKAVLAGDTHRPWRRVSDRRIRVY